MKINGECDLHGYKASHGRNNLLYNQYREKPTQIEIANSTQFKSTTLIIAAIIDEDRLLQRMSCGLQGNN